MSAMTRNSFRRGGMNHSPNAGFGRMLLLSLGLHLLTFLIFGSSSFFHSPPPHRDIYHVDLLTLPAKKTPGPVVPATPSPKPAAPVVKPPPKAAAPQVKPVVPPPPKKPAVAPAPVKPAPPAVTVPTTPARPSERDLSAVAARIEALQKQQVQDDIAGIKDRLAQLKAGLDAPVTAPATGGQDGGAELAAKVTAYLTDNWTLSAYQIKGDEGPATFVVNFNAGGELTDFKLKTSSGSAIFDQSARNTILRSKKLPFSLERVQEFEVVFDPEELKKKK